METPNRQGELFDGAAAPRSTVHVSARCCVHVHEGHWVVLGSGVPLLHFAEGDALARAHAIVSIVVRCNERPSTFGDVAARGARSCSGGTSAWRQPHAEAEVGGREAVGSPGGEA